MVNSGLFEVETKEVHSADDLVLMVNLGVDGLFKRVRARLYQVDTPNAYRLGSATEAGTLRDEVRKRLMGAHSCKIALVAERKGGWLVNLYVQDVPTAPPICLNEYLISKGYAYKERRTDVSEAIA